MPRGCEVLSSITSIHTHTKLDLERVKHSYTTKPEEFGDFKNNMKERMKGKKWRRGKGMKEPS